MYEGDLKIQEIETYKTHNSLGYVAFAGTLTNQYTFSLHERVYIQWNGQMMKCEVIGVELPLGDNMNYIYKVRIPSERNWNLTDDTTELLCDKIFKSEEDAYKSAIKQIELTHKLNIECVNRFFGKTKIEE